MSRHAVLLPGFNGSARQPLLLRLEALLEARGFEVDRLAPPRLKLTPALEAHVDWLEAQTTSLRGPLALVGRSFGGRLAIRLAQRRRLDAVALLGFPIRPPGKRRPLDEAALAALTIPTLVVQGTQDELGPLRVVRPLVSKLPKGELFVLEGAGHGFGAKEQLGLAHTADWLDRVLPRG